MAKTAIASKESANTAAYVGSVQRLLYELARLMERCDELCLAQHGITVSQGYGVLSLPEDGDLVMNALSDAMGVAGSTATRLIDQLVRKGLVTRTHDPKDRRIVRVALTRKGQTLRRELAKASAACFTHAFAEVPESERPTIVRVLESITQSLAEALDTVGCVTCSPK